jgi:arylformamidase
MMKIYDISLTISSDLPVWPGDMKVQLERTKKMEEGAYDNLSRVAMGVHTGTHVDAPYHFVIDGKKIDELTIDRFVGTVQVVELDEKVDLITSDVVSTCGIHAGMDKVLFKTRNSG